MPIPAGVQIGLQLAPYGLSLGKKLFGGLFGGKSQEEKNREIIEQMRKRIMRTGGAAQKLQEGVLRQNLAGGSRLQATNVLGQQQNRAIESIFNTLSEAEIQALQMLLGAQGEQARLKFLQDQQTLGMLGDLSGSLGKLFAPKLGTTGAGTTSTANAGSVQGLSPEMVKLLGQLFNVQSLTPKPLITTNPSIPTYGVRR